MKKHKYSVPLAVMAGLAMYASPAHAQTTTYSNENFDDVGLALGNPAFGANAYMDYDNTTTGTNNGVTVVANLAGGPTGQHMGLSRGTTRHISTQVGLLTLATDNIASIDVSYSVYFNNQFYAAANFELQYSADGTFGDKITIFTINPGDAATPLVRTWYDLTATIDAADVAGSGGFTDTAKFRWLTGKNSLTFIDDVVITGYTINPRIVPPTSPADDSTGVYPGTDLVATFSKNISLTTTGTIEVTDGSDSHVVNLDGTADDGDASITDNVLTITLDSNLANYNATYDVLISSDAIVDTAPEMNPFAGTGAGDWSFTTVVFDANLPTITLKSPDDEDVAAASTSIVATFSVPVLADTGNITIVDVTGAGADTRTFPVTDERVSFSGSEMTIVPSPNLLPDKTYAVQIAVTAVKNYSEVNFAGIVADTTTWNFETVGPKTLTWDPSGIDGTSDGSGTWLDAGKWWDGSGNVDWFNGPDSAIIGNGGAGGTITLGAVSADTVLIENFTGKYELSGTSLNQSGGITVNTDDASDVVWLSLPISGDGGVTMNGPGYLRFENDTVQTYTGTTTLNGGVTMMGYVGSTTLSPGPLTLNGGVLEAYYTETFNRTLGTAAGEVQILGGASGFSMNASIDGLTVRINNNAGYELVWGALNEGGNANATGFFNPSALVLQSEYAQSNSALTFQNKIDLNGAPRTVSVNKTSVGSGYAQMKNIIRNSDTINPAGLIKSGPGRLILSAANTYDGGTTVTDGTLTIDGSLADASMVISGGTVNGTGTLTFNVNGVTSDLVDATGGGEIDISGLTVGITETGAGLDQAEYILVDATGGTLSGGTFAGYTGPAGYELNYGTANQVKLVVAGAGNDFSDWIAGFPGVGGLTGFNDDFDNDGNGNGLENYYGTDPSVFSEGMVSVGLVGNIFTFTHPLNATPADDVSAAYQWSTDLATFYADGSDNGAGTTVTFSQGTPSAGMVTVTATIAGPVPAKLFVNIEVTQP